MKKVILMRHGQSELAINDFERNLTEVGIANTLDQVNALKNYSIDLIFMFKFKSYFTNCQYHCQTS